MCEISKLPDFIPLNAVEEKYIDLAENELNVRFSDEYRKYASLYGAVSVLGHDFTGLCSSKRLNVVDVTLYERKYNKGVPGDWYVLEQANIDSIVIWQNGKGEIYQTCPGYMPEKIADSIIEYLNLFEE